MLTLSNISVQIKEKKILNQISLSFENWKNYAILGQNWSWKSSLALTLMWHPNYQITNWIIQLDWTDITSLSPDQRARKGIFLAFQHIPEIPWVKLFEFLKWVYDNTQTTATSFMQFKAIIEPLLEKLKLSKEFLRRDLNVGFSGWERRKFEILQIELLQPKYIILDEIDSWLDVDAFKIVAEFLANFNLPHNTFIIITHIFSILNYISVDETFILKDWQIDKKGWNELISQIKTNGFK